MPQQFYSGNVGGNWGPPPGYMQAAMEPSRIMSASFANMGKSIGDGIQQYMKNKDEREGLIKEVELIGGMMGGQMETAGEGLTDADASMLKDISGAHSLSTPKLRALVAGIAVKGRRMSEDVANKFKTTELDQRALQIKQQNDQFNRTQDTLNLETGERMRIYSAGAADRSMENYRKHQIFLQESEENRLKRDAFAANQKLLSDVNTALRQTPTHTETDVTRTAPMSSSDVQYWKNFPKTQQANIEMLVNSGIPQDEASTMTAPDMTGLDPQNQALLRNYLDQSATRPQPTLDDLAFIKAQMERNDAPSAIKDLNYRLGEATKAAISTERQFNKLKDLPLEKGKTVFLGEGNYSYSPGETWQQRERVLEGMQKKEKEQRLIADDAQKEIKRLRISLKSPPLRKEDFTTGGAAAPAEFPQLTSSTGVTERVEIPQGEFRKNVLENLRKAGVSNVMGATDLVDAHLDVAKVVRTPSGSSIGYKIGTHFIPAGGDGFQKMPESGAEKIAIKLTAIDTAMRISASVDDAITRGVAFGPITGRAATMNVWSTDAAAFRIELETALGPLARQMLGSGVLTESDISYVRRNMPTTALPAELAKVVARRMVETSVSGLRNHTQALGKSNYDVRWIDDELKARGFGETSSDRGGGGMKIYDLNVTGPARLRK